MVASRKITKGDVSITYIPEIKGGVLVQGNTNHEITDGRLVICATARGLDGEAEEREAIEREAIERVKKVIDALMELL